MGKKIDSASWTSLHTGRAVLSEDWWEQYPPPIKWVNGATPLADLQHAPLVACGDESGYFIDQGRITFLLRPDRYPAIDWGKVSLYVAGDFNGWESASSCALWKLEPAVINEVEYFLLNIDMEICPTEGAAQFKFLTDDNQWLPVPGGAPNIFHGKNGNLNFLIKPHQTGRHIINFTTPEPMPQDGQAFLEWSDHDIKESVPIVPGDFFLEFKTDLSLGVQVLKERTIFRLFAPRASRVTVEIFSNPNGAQSKKLELSRADSVTWEVEYQGNLHGWYYNYYVDSGSTDYFSDFDYSRKILDPYALAAVGPAGPGIIWDRTRMKHSKRRFQPPSLQDLIILEAHVRDLTAAAPITLSTHERLGFTGLRKWAQTKDSYLRELGVNAIELQPVQEFDAERHEYYHWGYMTTNYFAPASSYASDPQKGSQIEEFQKLVDTLHEHGLAVILDVVYNHFGKLNHLALIDRLYYFELDYYGSDINWSGCGNTLRCSAPMTTRLIIESLLHYIEVYDIDGFRFDLAELLGLEVLSEIEKALKAVKPSIILIAEPWSFRGHIAHALKRTDYAYWNDGYRDFLAHYLLEHGDQEGIRYFLAGSTDYITSRPAQSINYVESHDDFCWLDRITENPEHNGFHPTSNDRRRTHLMVAILFSSLGIPMLSAGQDHLRSKHGIHNTFHRGDLNAIDYQRAASFPGTSAYFRQWIKFRLSDLGRLFRLESKPGEGYLRFFGTSGRISVAALYNADYSLGQMRLLFAVNPHLESVEIRLEGITTERLTQLADHERFAVEGLKCDKFEIDGSILAMPELSCGLWVEDYLPRQ